MDEKNEATEKPENNDSICVIGLYVDRFIRPNSEKWLDYSISHETKKVLMLSFLLAFLLIALAFPHASSFAVSRSAMWFLLIVVWAGGGYGLSEWIFMMTKERYKRFVSRDFNYWPNEKMQESIDDDVVKKEMVEYMDQTLDGHPVACPGSKWSCARRIYYKLKINEQLELSVSILQTICLIAVAVVVVVFGSAIPE